MKKAKEGIFFFKPNLDESHLIPLTNNNISAGFPSPADDFKEIKSLYGNDNFKAKVY